MYSICRLSAGPDEPRVQQVGKEFLHVPGNAVRIRLRVDFFQKQAGFVQTEGIVKQLPDDAAGLVEDMDAIPARKRQSAATSKR